MLVYHFSWHFYAEIISFNHRIFLSKDTNQIVKVDSRQKSQPFILMADADCLVTVIQKM